MYGVTDEGHAAAIELFNISGTFKAQVDLATGQKYVADLVAKEAQAFTAAAEWKQYAGVVKQLRLTRQEAAAIQAEVAALQQQFEAALVGDGFEEVEKQLTEAKRRAGLYEERIARLAEMEAKQRAPLAKAWRSRMQSLRAEQKGQLCTKVWMEAATVKAKIAALLKDYFTVSGPLMVLESPECPLATCNDAGLAGMPMP